ncbi:hypothetical protein CUZ56_01367 [Saezia sanguinis]|uniref:Integrating conjugative element protein n=1 Tax=Saezia sanguinis TaxID=1965230 RepID=A0A433SFC2_9BURK|nr:integrating conjugative element protein [Saezia sanguinis]RUS67422.1 hypothetical protein CUZ56_01367 [Saezia sanguinis]
MKTFHAIFAFSGLLLCSALACAQSRLIVVDNLGGTSAAPYYDAMGLTAEVKTPSDSLTKPPRQVDDSFVLPVRSSLLSPGKVSARQISAPGLSPIFLIGDDNLSKRWLVDRYQSLAMLHAIGLVVQVESAQGLQTLRNLVPDLQLLPVNGNDLARRLNVQHYPVLITAEHIEQ